MSQTQTPEPSKASASDAGCWIDGHWGQYGRARMVELAQSYGYAEAEVIDIADRHMAQCNHPTADLPEISTAEHEILSDAMDEVEQWMNARVAPEGYAFEWSDGEFFLSSTERYYVMVTGHGAPDEPTLDDASYDDAVGEVDYICDGWESSGWTVDRSHASSGNYYAARAVDSAGHVRTVAVEREDS